MCFKKRGPDPKIAEQQAQQEKETAAAKAQADAKRAKQRAAELEKARQDAVKQYKAEQEKKRQEEAAKIVSDANIRQDRISKFGSVSTSGRASRRSGSRGRRSLITGLGGGIGYYDRFSS